MLVLVNKCDFHNSIMNLEQEWETLALLVQVFVLTMVLINKARSQANFFVLPVKTGVEWHFRTKVVNAYYRVCKLIVDE